MNRASPTAHLTINDEVTMFSTNQSGFTSEGHLIDSNALSKESHYPVAYGLIDRNIESEIRIYLFGYPNQFASLKALLTVNGVTDQTPVYDNATQQPLGTVEHLMQLQNVLDNVVKSLDQSKEYSFLTAEEGRSIPCPPKVFLNSKAAKEAIISIDDGFGPDSKQVWSGYTGWNVDQYSKLVEEFASLVNNTVEINPEFISQALDDEISVIEAVNSWFIDEIPQIQIHSNINGFIDFDIKGETSIRRICVTPPPKNNEFYNMYYGESSKGGMKWNTDLITSINNSKK